jgi:hypothetical protein
VLVLQVLSAAGMVSPMTLMLSWPQILWRFQVFAYCDKCDGVCPLEEKLGAH